MHLLFVTSFALIISGIAMQETCVPEIKLDDKCTVCTCGLSASCAKLKCPPGKYDDAGRFIGRLATEQNSTSTNNTQMSGEELQCNPGSVFMNSCNTCICNQQGTAAVCTKFDCIDDGFAREFGRYRRSIESDDLSCIPGESFTESCNTCICDRSGKSGTCTQKICPLNLTNSKKVKRNLDVQLEIDCEPRSTFKDDCNLCICSESGEYAVCTTTACVPGLDFGARFQKGKPQKS